MNGKYVCMWRNCCQEEYEKDLVVEWTEENDETWTGKREVPDSARQAFDSKKEWKEHVKTHSEKVAWFMGDGPKDTDLCTFSPVYSPLSDHLANNFLAGEPKTEDPQLYRFDASGKEVVPSIATQTQETGSMRENNRKRFRKVHDGKGIISIPLRDMRRKGGGNESSSASGGGPRNSIVQVVIQSKSKATANELEILDSESEDDFISAGEEPTLSRPIGLGGGMSLGRTGYGRSTETSDAMEIDESEDELTEGDQKVLGLIRDVKDVEGSEENLTDKEHMLL